MQLPLPTAYALSKAAPYSGSLQIAIKSLLPMVMGVIGTASNPQEVDKEVQILTKTAKLAGN
ncbi:MAG: hypothetical protein IH984_02215 [Planctomycetes bacterium]|nr:hypothetical protein [Planctomycetota bacterium]